MSLESVRNVEKCLFHGVKVRRLDDEGSSQPVYHNTVNLLAKYDPYGLTIIVDDPHEPKEFIVSRNSEFVKTGKKGIIFMLSTETLLFTFATDQDAATLYKVVVNIKESKGVSVFTERTDDSSATQYFQFYGYLSQQQNMMQDFIRTSTYQRAILDNPLDFTDKVVLDVGAGSGILSFFAQQAGARRVYAVEASSIATHAAKLVEANKADDVIKVISGKIEEVELPEKVDIIISEPMGYMLLNERMLETFLHAKKFLKPGGKMFPSRGDLHFAPFTDEALYMEQNNKVNFWYQEYFHGVNLTSLREPAMVEYFRQPIVDTFDINICTAKTARHVIDFQTSDETDLHRIEIPVEFHILQSATVHGLAFWFDVAFIGTNATVWLSTAPTQPLTHWYQVRCLLSKPIFAKQGQLLTGRVLMVANAKQSYDLTIECRIEGTQTVSSNTLDLKNPYFSPTLSGEYSAYSSDQYEAAYYAAGEECALNLSMNQNRDLVDIDTTATDKGGVDDAKDFPDDMYAVFIDEIQTGAAMADEENNVVNEEEEREAVVEDYDDVEMSSWQAAGDEPAMGDVDDDDDNIPQRSRNHAVAAAASGGEDDHDYGVCRKSCKLEKNN